MSYKTILVCIDSKEEAERLLPVANMVARKFDAHLIGVHSLQDMEINTSIYMELSGAAMEELQTIEQRHAAEMQEAFEHLTNAEDFLSEWQQIEAFSGTTGERLAEHARCADLVIMAQIDPEHSHPGLAAIQHHVIEHSGRPVLVIPLFGDFKHIGERPLIGWSGTAECTRAVHDAIPFCRTSSETRIVWVNGGDKMADARLQQTGHQIATAMDRHGINATVSHRVKTNIPIGDELLNEAADSGADMIITGAYGHSRLYDLVIGATTSHLLRFMTTPVLFSH